MTSIDSNTETDQWFETEVEAKDGTPDASAKLLSSIAGTIHQAPECKRYDIELTVTERDIDE